MKKGFVLLVFIAALSIVLIAPASAQIEFIEPTASAADETARDVSPEFAGIVADLAASGKIPGTNGEYYYLDNFSDEWAQLQWYQWIRRSGITMTNFVLRSKIQYESASDTPNWGDSGCGWYVSPLWNFVPPENGSSSYPGTSRQKTPYNKGI